MIKSCEKQEEYRDITPYWISRIFKIWDEGLKKYRKLLPWESEWYSDLQHNGHTIFENAVRYGKLIHKSEIAKFYIGYSKNRESFFKIIKKVEIREGREEWGAEKRKKYIVLILS